MPSYKCELKLNWKGLNWKRNHLNDLIGADLLYGLDRVRVEKIRKHKNELNLKGWNRIQKDSIEMNELDWRILDGKDLIGTNWIRGDWIKKNLIGKKKWIRKD